MLVFKDAASIEAEIVSTLSEQVFGVLRRKGIVVGVSGGVDSAVVAGLAARAVGREHVLALLMPERDSSPASLELGREVAETFGVRWEIEDLGPTLAGAGCYARQDEAIRSVFPEFAEGWRCKLTLPPLLDSDRISVSRLTVRSPAGVEQSARLPAPAYRQLVAATNMKQRARKSMEYYHADRLAYAVAGTPNRLEWDQGFFVKQGDGAADVKPIAHLYKTDVYALAEMLGVPAAVRSRPPSTDTFSLDQTQDEFFFGVPWKQLDYCLRAHDAGVSAADVAEQAGLDAAQVERVYRDIVAKRRTTRYLHLPPLLVREEGAR